MTGKVTQKKKKKKIIIILIAFTAHRHWVLVTSWSPDGLHLASGCKTGQVIIWDPKTGKVWSL